MTQTIELQIRKRCFQFNENDIILDNGSIFQVITKEIANGFDKSPLIFPKKLFKELKTCAFVYEDTDSTAVSRKTYSNPNLNCYKFNIPRMVKMGYGINEKGE